jgi:TP901 family phage tail tape measure protein
MAKAITLGVVLGAKLAPGFGAVFKTAREQAQGLKTTLANARLGSTAAADVARLGARLDRLRASQATLGTDNVKLANRIAQTQRELNKASATAGRYGVSLDNATSKHRAFAASADHAARSLARLRAAEQRKAVRDEAKGQILGTVGAVMTVAAPVKESMEFEHRLAGIGNIAEMTNQQVTGLGKSVLRTGVEVNQTSSAMLDAYNVLLGKGLDSGRATALLGIIGKTSTGEQASIEDMSTTTFALLDNLKVAESQIPKSMDMLAQAGKEGAFELKDMARYFPQLTAQAATLGLKGTEAVGTLGAALQVAMKGAGSPEEAATNLRNFLQKATAPDTIKNFAKMGVNLEASLKKAVAGGANPLEYLLGLIQKVTKGDKFKVGQLFGDMQVQNFLAPMMQHMEEYREIKQKALGASGVVDRDFANMMATGTERVKHARVELGRLAVTLGTVLLPALGDAADKFGAVLSVVSDLAQRYPGLTTVVAFAAVGLVGFKVASLAARFGGTLLLDGVSLLVGAFNFFRPSVLAANASLVWHKALALGSAAAHGVWQGALLVGRGAMLAFAGVMKVVTAAQWLWNAALTANPIGLVITAVAALGAAAYLIYENWEPIKAWFKGLWATVGNLCSAAMAEVKSLVAAPLDYLEAKANKLLALVGLGKKNDTVAAVPATTALGKSVSAHRAPAVNGTQVVAASHGPKPLVPATAAPALPAPISTHGSSAFPARQGPTPPEASAAAAVLPAHQGTTPKAAAAIAPALPAPQSSMPSSQASTPQAPGMSATRQLEAELARLTAASKQTATDTSSPGKSGAEGKRLPPVTMHNTVNVTFTGMESVENAIKKALEAFSREMEGRIAAIRDQQARLSFGG